MPSLRWTYEGVDHSFPGNGGPECASYLGLSRRIWESALVAVFGLAYVFWGFRRATLPRYFAAGLESKDQITKKLLLVVMCLIFGCELGFKCANKTLIYLLNPCHIVTVVQIFLLVAPPSPLVTVLFRLQMHSLNGAFLAIAFPVVNTRMLPFEMEIYYLQHAMMLVIPFYLLKIGGVYTLEKIQDFSWSVMTAGYWMLYHFLPLQFLGMLTQVNLNSILCPAISDPFYGQNYRIWAFGHQSLLIGLIGKFHSLICRSILRLLGCEDRSMNGCNGDAKCERPVGDRDRCKRLPTNKNGRCCSCALRTDESNDRNLLKVT